MSIKINLSTAIFCLILLLIGFSGYQISQAQTTHELSVSPIQLCNITRDLKFGMIGTDVKELQKYLNNNGSPLAQTGFGSRSNETNYFGFLTKQALTNFQVRNKLNATGIFDSATRDFLSCEKPAVISPIVATPTTTPPNSICNITRDLKFGMIGTDIKELQKYLNNNGSPLAQTGFGSRSNETNYFGFLTKQALTNFQVRNKLNATGIFDSATRDFLSCEKENNLVPKVETPKQDNNQSPTQSEDNKYSISGSITGISDVVTLHNNNNDIITIKPGDSANFVFPKKIINGSAYNVTVETDNLNQKCYLKNNIGTINNANVDNIGVACGLGLSYNPFTRVFSGGGGGGSSPSVTTYTVTFDTNGGDGGSTATQTLDYNTPTALTANGFTKTGYTFSGWNTLANGTGTAYADEADYTIGTANVTLYAQWTINTYTVTFDGNTSDGGSTATQTLDYNTPTALTANGYTKTGYTFSGWNTLANGTGTAYADEADYTIGTANVTLYAQWTINTYTVTFDTNGGDGGSTATQTLDYNTPTALTANGYTKTGYTFSGWNTLANGSGTAYADTADYTIGTANVTLYAQWTINTYTVTFDGNTSDGGSTATQTLDYNTPTALTANGYTKTGYTFSGWNTLANGTGTAYADEADYTIGTANVTLYAQWTVIPFVCGDNVSFTYNGSPVTYGTVNNPATGECWLDRNLGATQVALSSTDSAAYGHLFQWGRLDDGHQVKTSGTTSTNSSGDVPGHSNFILEPVPSYDWRVPQNDNLWQGASGINNPCPSGFRVPTETEMNTERLSWSSNNTAGAFASPLKLPVAGNRYDSDGSLGSAGSNGYYWSSTINGTDSRNLAFSSANAYVGSNSRALGFTVRCLKD